MVLGFAFFIYQILFAFHFFFFFLPALAGRRSIGKKICMMRVTKTLKISK